MISTCGSISPPVRPNTVCNPAGRGGREVAPGRVRRSTRAGGHEDAMGKGKECGHPIPSASMAQRQPGKQQKKRVLLCVSDNGHPPRSMTRDLAFAIGLSNYPKPVMPTRTIVLPAVSKTLAQAPARPAARCASPGVGATTEKHRCSSEFGGGRSTRALTAAYPCLPRSKWEPHPSVWYPATSR